MHLKSPYPPPPQVPAKNYFALTLELSQQYPAPVPDHVLFIDPISREERTKSQFFERVYDTATALGAPKEKGGLGLNKNHTVGILSHNCLDYPVITFALLSIATPFAPYSSFATTHELEHYHAKAQSTHMFVHADSLERFLPVAKKMGFPQENIFILEGEHDSKFKDLNSLINTVRTRKIPREPIRDVQRSDIAYLIFSSGTGGPPKCVMVSHGNLCFTIFQDIMIHLTYLKHKPPTEPAGRVVVLGFVPMFHTMGLHYLGLKAPIGYFTMVILPKWNKDVFIEAIPKYRVTNIIVIPSAAQQLLSSPKFYETDLSSVQSIGCAASYLPPSLAKKLEDNFKAPLSEGFGMSEATLSSVGRNQFSLIELGLFDPKSTGVMMPGMEGLILRPDGTHCLVNEPGELFIKGDNITSGYRDDPEATKAVYIGGGWLRTGDRFLANEKGVLYFQDRAKDTLKVSGLQVSPVEIEEVIHREPSGIVQDVSVVGVQLPSARTSDDKAPRAWVVLTEEGRRLSESEAKARIDAWVKERLSKYKWLRGGIKFLDTIPRNVTGKPLRRLLAEEYEAEKIQAQGKL